MIQKELEAMKEIHYKNIKTLCWNYQDKELVSKYSFFENTINNIAGILNPCRDPRLFEVNKLIDNLIEERDRINEIDALGANTELGSDNKIEKIEIDDKDRIKALSTDNYVYKLNQPMKNIIYKLNELIEAVNELKEDK